MSSTLSYLKTLLETASDSLSGVTWRRMFGCDAVFAQETIYGLIWKTERIGLRFPDQQIFQKALALEGAEPWTIQEKTMSNWVLLPEEFHDDEEQLLQWVQKAHALAIQHPKSKTKSKPST